MGIMQEMGWAIQQMMVPGISSIIAMATSKFFENSDNERAHKWATIIRVSFVAALLLLWVVPRIDGMTTTLSVSAGGGGFWDTSTYTPHYTQWSGPASDLGGSWGNTNDIVNSSWQSASIGYEAMRQATIHQLQPLTSGWTTLMDVISR